MAEIAMRAKILRARLRSEPDAVFEVIASIERLEDELLEAIGNFESEAHK